MGIRLGPNVRFWRSTLRAQVPAELKVPVAAGRCVRGAWGGGVSVIGAEGAGGRNASAVARYEVNVWAPATVEGGLVRVHGDFSFISEPLNSTHPGSPPCTKLLEALARLKVQTLDHYMYLLRSGSQCRVFIAWYGGLVWSWLAFQR
jgi:hypothetical protein